MALADMHHFLGLAGTDPNGAVRAGSVGSNTSPGMHSCASWRRTPRSTLRSPTFTENTAHIPAVSVLARARASACYSE